MAVAQRKRQPRVSLAAVRDTIEGAYRLLQPHDPYRLMTRDELMARVDIPFFYDCAALVDDRLFFSWMWPEADALKRQTAGQTPYFTDWKDEGDTLWIVDMAAAPGTPGTWVGRRIMAYLYDDALARDGEQVLFRRHRRDGGRRLGWATIRS